MHLLDISDQLTESLSSLTFAPPVTHVYNPLDYAREPHADYIRKYGKDPREVVLVAMNPGPWGMAQVGVPFGEINLVRDWLHIEGNVGKPAREHPKRPILGWDCPRSEVSGKRLWGWAKETYGTAQAFFERFYITNYCPLVFMEESGRNRTPDRLKVAERKVLLPICDQALRNIVEYIQPRYVLGIGNFTETRARLALEGLDVQIGKIPHPSPANPQGNKGWSPLAQMALREMGIALP